ncbi:CFI-box-CTERM domain-containing protein [Bdellovibrio bacteriovorus]|uniref:CFI-box-CTERM domain-containing protein n=1 Tax=Bdellovibrio TaxID=958 RepID=UPI0035A96CAB
MALFPRIGIQSSFFAKTSLVLVGLFFVSSQSFAAMTLASITGVSGKDESDTTKPIVYGGFAGTCTGDGTLPCDSCTGDTIAGSKLWPCNKNNAYANLRLTIRTNFTLTGATANKAFLKSGEDQISATFTIEDSGTVLNTQIPWGQLCSEFGVGTDCKGSFDKTLTVGIEGSNTSGTATTESMSVRIVSRYVEVGTTAGTEWFYTDCNTTEATTNYGFCHFEVFPGDEKVYADNLVVSPGYPASTAGGIEYTNLVFFYREQPAGEDDNTTIANLSNKEGFFSVGINKAASPPVADNRIDGLVNGARYCMVMANQDATGIISFFTPIPGTPGSPVTVAELCTTPSEVIGLLDDKSCFIATAAFGSDMAPEVQSFRDFRNEFLLTNSWGRAFVKFYYKYSPYYANMIAESEVTKAVVRTALWPLLYFARMSVALGFWTTLLILSLAVASFYELYRRLILGRRFRGEL